nr:hypothetical protein CFP56_35580 [Quercus suber]
MRGHGMHVPLAPYIPSRDPPIWRHEIEYMPVPLGFSTGRASPSSGPATSDGANDGSAERFVSDSIRDDDSL